MLIAAFHILATAKPAAVAELAGGYKADWSRAVGTHGPLKAFFGQSNLRLKSDGTFNLLGDRMRGFWRVDGDRIVLIYSGFFGMPYAKPDEILKKLWPKDLHQGMVLGRGARGSLVLREFGAVKGPIVFRKRPLRSFDELLRLSGTLESSDDFKAMDAFEELADRLHSEWPKLIALIGDSQKPIADRQWATYFFRSLPEAGIAASLQLLDHPDISSAETKEKIRLRRALISNLARTGVPGVATPFLDNEARLKISGSDLAHASAVAGHRRALPRMLDLLADKSEWVRSAAIEAIAKIGATEELPRIQAMTSDADPMVKVAAWCAILDMSSEQERRKEAVRMLGTLFDSNEFVNDTIMEAMGRSRMVTALPYLSHRLLNLENPREQAVAAEALAQIRLPGAVSALLIAKKLGSTLRGQKNPNEGEMAQAMSSYFSVADVQKAVVEALWSYSKDPLR
ncbi:MAG TPA: HEAT repeat domain-containing protein [Fimbriimonas sp.]|nr:HEAT repeat domain-containing protein [Fimbriimonas sp.]